MLYWILQVILFSVIFILLVHNIFNYLKSTLTVPIIKDLENIRNKNYEKIFDIISNNEYKNQDILTHNDDNNGTTMKNELKTFLKSQLDNDETIYTTNISELNII
jgi:cupin superfamily acireductone dioxygenase involved in methionine salvage